MFLLVVDICQRVSGRPSSGTSSHSHQHPYRAVCVRDPHQHRNRIYRIRLLGLFAYGYVSNLRQHPERIQCQPYPQRRPHIQPGEVHELFAALPSANIRAQLRVVICSTNSRSRSHWTFSWKGNLVQVQVCKKPRAGCAFGVDEEV